VVACPREACLFTLQGNAQIEHVQKGIEHAVGHSWKGLQMSGIDSFDTDACQVRSRERHKGFQAGHQQVHADIELVSIGTGSPSNATGYSEI
jgi:hypothetical protein